MNHENIINSTIIGNKKMTSSKGNKFDNINLNKLQFYKKSIFVIIFFVLLLKISVQREINLGSSYIILHTSKKENVKIFSEEYFENKIKPSEIRINDIIQTEIKHTYILNESYNIINLTFSDYITDSANMFKGCSQLEEIDLSHFDTSNVEDMNNMFAECFFLKYLNLSFVNTSKVRSFKTMFDTCESLTSLDLSYFDTSKVENMDSMFSGCNSLNDLNFQI